MILAIDVGNTNITIGVFDGKDLKGTFRLTTKGRTSDEFGVIIGAILEQNGIDRARVDDVIISSVVPAIMHSLTSGIIKYFSVKPVIVTPGIDTGIKVTIKHPEQLGADRVVDAAGAFYIYGGPVLVIDFGTATTYDLVNEKGEFVTGVTAPGIRISAKALWNDAAKLPEIEIKKPSTILARETITSMQAGLVFGQIGQTEYIVSHMIEAYGAKDVKVVGTGGLGKMISNETDCIDVYDADLTLKGIRVIYERQNRNER